MKIETSKWKQKEILANKTKSFYISLQNAFRP